ncbi:MAG TPA: hypothetical protein VG055_29305 [Planctomycetaceae bacterium]|nr:hypothetical protein [Planctomycetaceae bacterium]
MLQTRRVAMLALSVLVMIMATLLLCWGIDSVPSSLYYQPVKWLLRMKW